MPNRHLNPAITVRPEPALVRRVKVAVHEVGSDVNAHVIEFFRWLVGDTDELPPRPPPAGRADTTGAAQEPRPDDT